MNIPLDTNLFAALAIVLPLAAGALAIESRRAASRQRERELGEALDLLKTHTEAMRKLDDDRVPKTLLTLVCALSRLLHDPDVRPFTLKALGRGPLPVEVPSTKMQAAMGIIDSDYDALLEKHPELATAYIQALVAGVLAFDKRWPECAGQFAVGLPQMVSSPVHEAQRIVQQAGRTYEWTGDPAGAIAA